MNSRNDIGVGFDFGGTLVPVIQGKMSRIVQRSLVEVLGLTDGHRVASRFAELEAGYWTNPEERSDGSAEKLLTNAMKHEGAEIGKVGEVLDGVMFEFVRHVDFRSEADFTIKRLSEESYRLGIYSNWIYPGGWIRKWLDYRGLSMIFTSVWSSSDSGIVKPDPQAFEVLASSLGIQSTENLAFVGDSIVEDVMASSAAGCRLSIFLKGGRDQVEPRQRFSGNMVRVAGRFGEVAGIINASFGFPGN